MQLKLRERLAFDASLSFSRLVSDSVAILISRVALLMSRGCFTSSVQSTLARRGLWPQSGWRRAISRLIGANQLSSGKVCNTLIRLSAPRRVVVNES